MNNALTTRATWARGFTLIEMMIIVVIVAILAGIAMNSHQNSVLKTKRKAALGSLYSLVGEQEEYFVNNKGYATDLTDLGYGATGAAADPYYINDQGDTSTSTDGAYKITFASATARAFTLTATPINSQVKDTQCAALSITSTGSKSVTGSLAATDCFR